MAVQIKVATESGSSYVFTLEDFTLEPTVERRGEAAPGIRGGGYLFIAERMPVIEMGYSMLIQRHYKDPISTSRVVGISVSTCL